MKKNVKAYVYDGRALKTLFMQLRNVIGITEKRKAQECYNALMGINSKKYSALLGIETTRKGITDICYEIVSNSDDATKYWVIHVFGKIINETGRYFNTLPDYAKGYYKDEFVKKMNSKYFRLIEKHVTDEKTRSHLKCLFKAYLSETVYKQVHETLR